jgi:signal transduction histidine kinase
MCTIYIEGDITMELIQMIPLLIPAGLFQLFLQVYAIKHVWDQKEIKENTRVLLIVAFITFNLMALAIYFFYIYQKDKKVHNDELNPHFRMGVLVLIIIAFQIFIIQLSLIDVNYPNENLVIWVGALVYVLLILNELSLYYKKNLLPYLISLILFLLALSLEWLTSSYPIQLMSLIILVAILNVLSSRYIKRLFAIMLVLYITSSILKANMLFLDLSSDANIAFIYTNTLLFILVFIAFATLKKQIINNQKLKILVERLETQSKQIEEMTVKEERIRMAHEIHDHVGHTLTTAIIQLESTLPLLSSGDEVVKDKINLSKEQVRLGLNQIRTLVKGVDIDFSLGLNENIQDIINDFKKNTDLVVHFDHDTHIEVLPIQQSIILSSIKEFFTNSVKHGHASEISILISQIKNQLDVTLSNNGKSSNEINYGFGLTQMDRSITSIGGHMKVSSTLDSGFSIYYRIPVGGSSDVKD